MSRVCAVLFAIAVWPASMAAQVVRSGSSQSLTLSDVLSNVVVHHPMVGAADARIRAAQGARRTAGALENPMLAYLVENAALPGGTTPPMERESMSMVTLPLQSLYQRWPRVQRANSELGAATAEAALRRQQLGLAAARAFYRTALAQIGVGVSRDLVSWLDSLVAYNRIRVEEGITAEADLIRSELERDRAVADEAMQAAELAAARAELGAFVEVAASARVAFDTLPFTLPPAAARSDSAFIGRRPDVHAAQQRVQAARGAVGVERSMLVSEIDATIGFKQSAGTTSLIAGASLPFPLFNRGRGEIARASAEFDAVVFELAAVERAARAELIAAHEANRILTETAARLATGFLARADEARRITLGAYREGGVPLLQVLDAARAWGEAQRTFYLTLFAQHQSVLALLVAQGDELTATLQLPNR